MKCPGNEGKEEGKVFPFFRDFLLLFSDVNIQVLERGAPTRRQAPL